MDEDNLYRLRELPEGVDLPSNFFDLVEMYHLNGPPASVSVFGKTIHSRDNEEEFLVNAKRIMENPRTVKPIIEFYILFEWDNGPSYALRLPDILALGIANGIHAYFDNSPALGFVINELAEMLYGGDGLEPELTPVPSKEI